MVCNANMSMVMMNTKERAECLVSFDHGFGYVILAIIWIGFMIWVYSIAQKDN